MVLAQLWRKAWAGVREKFVAYRHNGFPAHPYYVVAEYLRQSAKIELPITRSVSYSWSESGIDAGKVISSLALHFAVRVIAWYSAQRCSRVLRQDLGFGTCASFECMHNLGVTRVGPVVVELR